MTVYSSSCVPVRCFIGTTYTMFNFGTLFIAGSTNSSWFYASGLGPLTSI